MQEYTKIILVMVFTALYGYGIASVFGKEVAPSDLLISATTTPMLMVSKEALLDAVRQAKAEGGYLQVAVYEYDKKRDVWERASLDCVKERAQ